MPRTRLLHRDLVLVPLEAESLDDALGRLIDCVARVGALDAPGPILAELRAGAGKGTVRIAPEIVLPHFRTDAVSRLVVALAVAPRPLATPDAPGAGPRIVALVLAPTDETTLYLQAVSALVRAFREPDVIRALLEAKTVDDVFAQPELAAIAVRPTTTVAQLMTPVDAVATPDLTVRQAVELMLRSGSRALPVIGEKGEVLGILSETDVLRGLLRTERPGTRDTGLVAPLRVRDVMTRSVMCVADTAALEDVADLMVGKDVGEVPVVAEGRLAGLVRRADILRTLYGR